MNKDLVRNLFHYNPESGELVWKKRTRDMFKSDHSCASWNTRYAGKSVKTLDGKGYLCATVLGKRFTAHRLIWLYVNGKWPKFIDHINGVRTDNRISNLREVTIQQNHLNMRKSSNNTSGVTGVYLNKKSNLWCAQMKFKGKTYHLGSSKDKSEAIKMRKDEEKRLGFSERHGESC